MATPGDPFDTEDRDRLRWKHRRILREQEDWMGRNVRFRLTRADPPPDADLGLLEHALRAQAEAALQICNVDLDALAREAAGEMLARFLGGYRYRSDKFGGPSPLTEVAREARVAGEHEMIQDEREAAMERAVVLMILADEVAATEAAVPDAGQSSSQHG